MAKGKKRGGDKSRPGRPRRTVPRSRQTSVLGADMARRIVETANEGICIVDKDLLIRYVNDRACEMVGCPQEEALGRPVSDFVYPEDLARHQQVMADRRRGVSGRYEIRLKRKDGSPLWVQVSATPLADRRKRFSGSFAMFTDISHRKEAEANLERARATAQLYLDIAPCIILAINRSAQIVLLNREGRRILECEDADVIGRDWFDAFVPPDFRQQVRGVFAELMAGRAAPVSRFENEVVTLRGNRRTIVWHNNIVRNEQGQIVGVLSSGEDVTDLRRAEEHRRQLEAQLQRAERIRSLGMLAGGIAHDFNNFLTAITGNVDLASSSLPADSPAAAHLEEIRTTAERAALLCRQLLAFAGQSALRVEPLDLSELVRESAAMLRVAISRQASMEYELAEGLPLVNADAGQMRQVLMNLVMNASEALVEGRGRICVRTGAVHCQRAYLQSAWGGEELPEGWYVFMEVADSGCGMDRATQLRIFDPFFTTKKKGTGLGLAAVSGIVRSLHGAVHVSSRPGEGSTFRVLLPTAKVAGTEAAAARPASAGGVVLVVEDEPAVRDVMRNMLEEAGFEVLAADDVGRALALYGADHRRIACVVVDFSMDCGQMLSALRRTNPAVRVVITGGSAEEELRRRCEESGAAAFVPKPFARESLLSAVRRAIAADAGDKA